MDIAIKNTIDSKVCDVIRCLFVFFVSKELKAVNIHRKLCEAYWNNIKSDSAVRKW